MSRTGRDSIIKSTLAIAIIVVLSKGLGFIRDAIIAAFFGASFKTDAFFFASSMPGIPAISMSLSTVFLPMYVKIFTNNGRKDADRFASKIITAGIIIALFISILAIVLSPVIVRLLAPGFNEETRILAIKYTRIISSTLFLVMTHYMLLAILNANKKFGLPQLSGALLNIVYIIAVLVGARVIGINSLIAGALCGAVAQVLYLAVLSKKHFTYRPLIAFDKEVKSVLKYTVPVLLGNAVIQVHEMVDQLIGSTLPSGTISVLTYGLTLSNIVKTIIINALSSVFYPYISESVAKNDYLSLQRLIKKTYTGLILVLLPISLIAIICSRDIVSIVYERGSFSPEIAAMTAGVLLCYATGFVFSGLREISSKTLYSLNKMSTVTINGAIAVSINIVLSYVLSKTIGVMGIAVATAIAEIITAILLMGSVKKSIKDLNIHTLFTDIGKWIIAIIPLVGFGILTKYIIPDSIPLIRFVVVAVFGCASYFILLNVLKCEDAITLSRRIKKKFRKE